MNFTKRIDILTLNLKLASIEKKKKCWDGEVHLHTSSKKMFSPQFRPSSNQRRYGDDSFSNCWRTRCEIKHQCQQNFCSKRQSNIRVSASCRYTSIIFRMMPEFQSMISRSHMQWKIFYCGYARTQGWFEHRSDSLYIISFNIILISLTRTHYTSIHRTYSDIKVFFFINVSFTTAKSQYHDLCQPKSNLKKRIAPSFMLVVCVSKRSPQKKTHFRHIILFNVHSIYFVLSNELIFI